MQFHHEVGTILNGEIYYSLRGVFPCSISGELLFDEFSALYFPAVVFGELFPTSFHRFIIDKLVIGTVNKNIGEK